MLKMGVHVQAVKQKMEMNGVDSSIIELDPNAPSPNGTPMIADS